MKTREQIYGQEAAGILRDVSMYRALTEMQLLKLYPHKESKIRNLLSYLQKQGRIVQRGEYYRIPADAEESIDHGLSKAVGVFVKRNFLGAGKSYTIKGKQAEKKAKNALCGRLKCVLVAGNIKPLPTSSKRLRQGYRLHIRTLSRAVRAAFCSLFEVGGAGREAPQKPTVNVAKVQTVLPLK